MSVHWLTWGWVTLFLMCAVHVQEAGSKPQVLHRRRGPLTKGASTITKLYSSMTPKEKKLFEKEMEKQARKIASTKRGKPIPRRLAPRQSRNKINNANIRRPQGPPARWNQRPNLRRQRLPQKPSFAGVKRYQIPFMPGDPRSVMPKLPAGISREEIAASMSICDQHCAHHCTPECDFRCCVPDYQQAHNIPPPQQYPLPSGETCMAGCPTSCYPLCLPSCCSQGEVRSPVIPSQQVTNPMFNLQLPVQPQLANSLMFQSSCGQVCSPLCYPQCSQACCMASNSQPVPSLPQLGVAMAKQAIPQVPDQRNNCGPMCIPPCAPMCDPKCCSVQPSYNAPNVGSPLEQKAAESSPATPCSPTCALVCLPPCSIACCSPRGLNTQSQQALNPGIETQQIQQQIQQPNRQSCGRCSAICAPTCHPACCRANQQQQMMTNNMLAAAQARQLQAQRRLQQQAARRCPANCSPLCSPRCLPTCCKAQAAAIRASAIKGPSLSASFLSSSAQHRMPPPAPNAVARTTDPKEHCPNGCPNKCAPACKKPCCIEIPLPSQPIFLNPQQMPQNLPVPSTVRILDYCADSCPASCAPLCLPTCCVPALPPPPPPPAPATSPPTCPNECPDHCAPKCEDHCCGAYPSNWDKKSKIARQLALL